MSVIIIFIPINRLIITEWAIFLKLEPTEKMEYYGSPYMNENDL